MKLCILIPDERNLDSAGVRIRYRRIEERLKQSGHELAIMVIQDVSRLPEYPHDAYLISKCYDARAHLATHLLKRAGKMVGVDLFDDYFSQAGDSRFTRLRVWLNSLIPLMNFVLCSTPAMRDVARKLAPQLPAHVMNDPLDIPDVEAMRSALNRKLEYARRTRTLRLAWFGMGDNPHFPVGLDDLVAFGNEIARLRGQGFDVRLEVLTNQRALTPDRLAMLRRLALPHTVEEWTVEREAALLVKSLACFLPVNGQGFSTVKSLNRAVAALGAGVQVISSGYPLYEALDPLIYRDPAALPGDIEAGTLALREDTIPQFTDLMDRLASPEREADALVAFLEAQGTNRPRARRSQRPILAVVHGQQTLGDAHKFAQRMGALSIASPFCREKLNFDLRFMFAENGPGLEVYISQQQCEFIRKSLRDKLVPHGKILDREFLKTDATQVIPGIEVKGAALSQMNSTFGFAAARAQVIASVEQLVQNLFPGIECILSENSKTAWWGLPAQKPAQKEPA